MFEVSLKCQKYFLNPKSALKNCELTFVHMNRKMPISSH